MKEGQLGRQHNSPRFGGYHQDNELPTMNGNSDHTKGIIPALVRLVRKPKPDASDADMSPKAGKQV